jgi:hypothetical protein
MHFPSGWKNPITVRAGHRQQGVDPHFLLPARLDLVLVRLEYQRQLLRSRQVRHTPIQVTCDGVIWDGHHAVRAAAEEGQAVEVLVVDQQVDPVGLLILDLPVG